jgi:UDP-glucose 4-epimerase
MLKILILGSEGFVGKNLVDGLSKNHQVFCADQLDSSSHENYKKFDITNFESVENTVENVDVVIHLAAHSLVSSLDGSITNGRVNIIGLLNLLEVCRKKNIKKIIFTSASSLIGEPTSEKVKEDHPPKPKTAYGITKLTSEHYLRLYNELYDIDYVIFRFFNIYGPHQKNGLIPSLYSRMSKNESLTVFGKGDQIRDYVFIQDVISFFERAIVENVANNKIFNMGTGKGTSILDVINILSETMDVEPKIDFKDPRPGEIGNFVADPEFLSSVFGSVPSTTVRDGIQKTVEWLKNT